MGAVISAVRDTLSDLDKKVEDMAKENLRQCQANAEMIAQNFQSTVREAYKNPEEYEKWKVAGGRQDREATFIGVATKDKPSSHIQEGVQALVSGIFGAMEGKASADSFHTALSDMISGAFDAFLGEASAGASQQSRFLIIPHGYAFYRVDVYMYKYTFSSQGFKDHYESQTVAYASRGILSSQDFKPDELVAYVSDMTEGDPDKMKKWLNAFKDMQALAKGLLTKA